MSVIPKLAVMENLNMSGKFYEMMLSRPGKVMEISIVNIQFSSYTLLKVFHFYFMTRSNRMNYYSELALFNESTKSVHI